MAKQKMKTVDMSITEDDLKNVVLPEELGGSKAEIAQKQAEEKARLNELKAAEKAKKEAKKAAKEEKKDTIQEKIEAKKEADADKPKKVVSQKKLRSKRYHRVRTLVDRTKTYELKKAVELVKKSSYSKFTGTVVADLVIKDQKMSAEILFPHGTGQSVRVAIATDELLKQIEKGVIDFDILVAEPKLMPKIAKYAKILGPKGLMPNPKNKTVVPDPEKRKKELEAGKISVKAEKKAPLMHVVVGKTDHEAQALIENLETLIKALGPKKIFKLVLSATMSPGIKVDLTPYQAS